MKKIQLLLVFIVFCVFSCTRDSFEPVEIDCTEEISYDNMVKAIINSSCSYSGCHDGAGGIGPGDYTVYNGRLLADLDSGSFERRVINQKDDPFVGMPPNNEVYASSVKDDLTEDELEIITCWLQSGYPEN